MRDGRLDEAFDIAQSEQIRQHRRGQKLIGRLAQALVKRGQDNLSSERVQLALVDCNKAEKLSGNTEGVARLRSEICAEMEQRRLRHQHRSLKVMHAREQIDNGWLSAGEQMLEDADGKDGQADVVRQHAAAARLQIDEAVAKAYQALQRNDLDAALGVLAKAGVTDNHSEKMTDLLSKVRSLSAGRIRENIADGRIDLAQSLWQKISPLADGSTEISELGSALGQCRQAAGYIAAGQPRKAVPLLRQLKMICPAAKWLNAVTNETRQAAELLEELASSPLGLNMADNDIDDTLDQAGAGRKITCDSLDIKQALPADDNLSGDRVAATAPSKFVMQIDGIGSFLVVRDKRVTVGPVSSSARPMVGLVADPNMPVAIIERSDEDYFLRASRPVQVNDTTTGEKLLVDDDRIALSPRCRMKFNIPNPASTTGTLTLASARMICGDIRRVILMDRDILIGPAMGNHIQAGILNDTVTLFVQGEKLFCAAEHTVVIDGKPAGKRAALALNKQIRIGEISLVLTEAGN